VHFRYNEETHTYTCHKAFFCLFREAISRVCEAVPGAKGAFKKRKVFFFFSSAVDCIFLVQHRGEEAGDFKAAVRIADLQSLKVLAVFTHCMLHLALWSGYTFTGI